MKQRTKQRTNRRIRALASTGAAALALGAALAAAPARATQSGGAGGAVLFQDDFSGGFTAADWSVYGGNAVPSTSSAGLRVAAGGVNPATGAPMFTDTTGQGTGGTTAGEADHGKWLAFTNHTASTGYPGYDAVPGQTIGCHTVFSGQTFGVGSQPFGSALASPYSDPRLATTAVVAGDLQNGLLFDILVTDDEIWASYESLQQTTGGTNPASFAYLAPIAQRTPNRWDSLGITFDKTGGTVTYTVDGSAALTLSHLGSRPAGRQHIVVDHGGVDRVVSPSQWACGLGMFTLLDDRVDSLGPQGEGLVRLASAPDFYFDTVAGEPTPAKFLDDQSLAGNRLWGQGAALESRYYAVVVAPR